MSENNYDFRRDTITRLLATHSQMEFDIGVFLLCYIAIIRYID